MTSKGEHNLSFTTLNSAILRPNNLVTFVLNCYLVVLLSLNLKTAGHVTPLSCGRQTRNSVTHAQREADEGVLTSWHVSLLN